MDISSSPRESLRSVENIDRVHQRIQERMPEHVEAIRALVRTPSISLDGTGISETAGQVKSILEGIGAKAEVIPTGGNPVVLGEIDVGKPKTLLIYGMYDVMPADGTGWQVPPFGGEIVELPDHGPCIVSRGICNSKGPLQGLINAIAVLQDLNSLPVNIKFLIEGEEELGSPSLAAFINQYQSELRCDASFSPLFGVNLQGRPALYLGFKGMLKIELTSRGGYWGGPRSREIHSMHGAWIGSPAWRLIRALQGLVRVDESIALDGLNQMVTGPSAEEERLIQELAQMFDGEALLGSLDVERFKYPKLHGADLLRQYLYSPVINLNGLIAGYTGAGVKTAIGPDAIAKLDIRLVPNMKVEHTVQQLQDYFAQDQFSDIDLRVIAAYEWSRVSVHEAVVQALLKSFRQNGYNEYEIWPFIGGSAPTYLLTDVLKIPFVLGGLGHGGNIHAVNEYASVAQLEDYEKSIASFLFNFAAEDNQAGISLGQIEKGGSVAKYREEDQ